MNARKATVIFSGLMGIVAFEVSSFEVTTKPFAQYLEAVKVAYIGRGKRKGSAVLYTDNIDVVVVDGWNLPKADEAVSAGHATTIANGAPSIAYTYALEDMGHKVLVDFRGHRTDGRGLAARHWA